MKRQRTADEWKTLIEEYRNSGKTQGEFCLERGLSVSSLQGHLRSDFVEVSPPTSRACTELEVSFANGTIVRIRS